jgi:hypothetical protein
MLPIDKQYIVAESCDAADVKIGKVIFAEGNGLPNGDLYEAGIALFRGEAIEYIVSGGNVATDDDGKLRPAPDGYTRIFTFADYSTIDARVIALQEALAYTTPLDSELAKSDDQAIVYANLTRLTDASGDKPDNV